MDSIPVVTTALRSRSAALVATLFWLAVGAAALVLSTIHAKAQDANANVSKSQVVSGLQKRRDRFAQFSIEYEGVERFPVGSYTPEVMMDSQEEPENGEQELWPQEEFEGQIWVNWSWDRLRYRSSINVRSPTFSVPDRAFIKSHRIAYLTAGEKREYLLFQPKQGNPGSRFAIEENTPEYFIGRDPRDDFYHNGPLGLALAFSTGYVGLQAGIPLDGEQFTTEDISSLKQEFSNALTCVLASRSGTQRQFVLEPDIEGALRVKRAVYGDPSRPVFEFAFEYDDQGIATVVQYAVFESESVKSHADLHARTETVSFTVADSEVSVPEVPVGGVMSSIDGRFFYVNKMNERVEFNPFIPRDSSKSMQVPLILAGVTLAILALAVYSFRRSSV